MNATIEELNEIYSNYVSNQESEHWTDPRFPIEVVYEWTSYTDAWQKTGTEVYRCPSEQFAIDLIAKWKKWQELGTQEIKWEYKILSMRNWQKAERAEKELADKRENLRSVKNAIATLQGIQQKLEDEIEILREAWIEQEAK